MTQKELYDFYLPDHNAYIEVDEEHHFHSGDSNAKTFFSKSDNNKIIKCLSKPATLIRLSWFNIVDNSFKKIIKFGLKKKNKLILSSRQIYGNSEMLINVPDDKIVYFSV